MQLFKIDGKCTNWVGYCLVSTNVVHDKHLVMLTEVV